MRQPSSRVSCRCALVFLLFPLALCHGGEPDPATPAPTPVATDATEDSAAASVGTPLQDGIGWRGDGGGLFPASNVPTSWRDFEGEEVKQGRYRLFKPGKAVDENILWKTPLPNWSTSSPVVAQGRVFVLCDETQYPEPTHLFPTLLCLDATTGTVLWKREVDFLPAGAEGDRIRALWRSELSRQGKMMQYVHSRGNADLTDDETLKALGWSGSKKEPREGKLIRGSEAETNRKELRKHNLRWCAWHGNSKWHGPYINNSFPTPVTDGERVYVTTGHNATAAFDFEGNLQWVKHFPAGNATHARWCPSPVLIGDLLIVTTDMWARAMHKGSGEVAWEVETPWTHIYACMTPIRMDLQGTEALFLPGGHVLRVADGAVLATKVGFQGGATQPVSDGSDRVFLCNGSTGGHYQGEKALGPELGKQGAYCLRLVMAEDGASATPEVLWYMPTKAQEFSPVLYKGRLYCIPDNKRRFTIVDFATGAVVQALPRRDMIRVGHAWVAAGDLLIGLASDGEAQTWRIQDDGTIQKVGAGRLTMAPLDDAKKRQIACECNHDFWSPSCWSRTVPFVAEDRIYIRTFDYLACIGSPATDAPAPNEAATSKASTHEASTAAADQRDPSARALPTADPSLPRTRGDAISAAPAPAPAATAEE